MYGAAFIGYYKPAGSRISGVVWDPALDSHVGVAQSLPPVSAMVVSEGEVVGSTTKFESHGTNWHFDIDLESEPVARDFLRDHIRILVLPTSEGEPIALRMDGASQLRYVKERYSPRSEAECVIDFSLNGNSRQYILDGWSGPEAHFTWTEGARSTIAIDFKMPGSRYGLEVRTWPFVVQGKVADQVLEISISDFLIGSFRVASGVSRLECEIPGELTRNGRVTIELYHPGAARPCDLTSSGDGRSLAFAVEEIALKRWLEAPV